MIRPLWIEVDLKALRHNVRFIKTCLRKNTEVLAVIKQGAYGHGLIPIAKELTKQGVKFLGVGSVEEALLLRKHAVRGSIIVLSSVLNNFVKLFLQYNIIPTIVDLKFAKKLNKEAYQKGKVVPVHVEVDSGMGRLGYYPKEAKIFIKELSKLRHISLEGIYTHFPAADTDCEFTKHQIEVFDRFILELKKEKITFKFCHCANSIGILNYPNAHFNMVRPGLILYGVRPGLGIEPDITPCLSLKTKVIFVKKINKGMSVSYECTFIAPRAGYIATVSVGYADGYLRSLSNNANVIIKDKLFSVAGRVCMDHIMIDLKDNKENVKIGDEVILIGKSKNLEIRAEDLAKWSKTISYEIVSRLSFKIPRIYKYSCKRSTEDDGRGDEKTKSSFVIVNVENGRPSLSAY